MVETGGRLQTSRAAFYERDIAGYATDPIGAAAFLQVDRRDFVPKGLRRYAYQNIAFDIGDRSSMSEPQLMAAMVNVLGLTGNERVLEIGTASGYGAALLSRCASEVYTVEYSAQLARTARRKLQTLGYSNVEVHERDGALGIPEKAPFDAIIVTAGAREIPQALEDQLADGGRIVVPVGLDPKHSKLIIGIKYRNLLLTKEIGNVGFHPLMSTEHGGWTDEDMQLIQDLKKKIIIQSLKLGNDEELRQHIATIYKGPVEEITDEDIAAYIQIVSIPDSIIRFLMKS